MIVEVTVSNIVVDQAAVTHGSKHVSTGTDPIPLGTTSAAGVVQLATTGVEEATKVPKATGADLAALLTAGGYTLTAPSGANSLDGIADTATWKKVAAAVATALNAGTYTASDADKVSEFGIGGDAKLLSNAGDIAALTKSGLYRSNVPQTDTPWSDENIYLMHIEGNSSYAVQLAFRLSGGTHGGMKLRVRVADTPTWSAWYEIWNAFSDGNGGQPPAPKPTFGTPAGGADTQGQAKYGLIETGNKVYYSGSTNLSGTWKISVFFINTSTGIIDRSILVGTYIGSGEIVESPSGCTAYFYTERII